MSRIVCPRVRTPVCIRKDCLSLGKKFLMQSSAAGPSPRFPTSPKQQCSLELAGLRPTLPLQAWLGRTKAPCQRFLQTHHTPSWLDWWAHTVSCLSNRSAFTHAWSTLEQAKENTGMFGQGLCCRLSCYWLALKKVPILVLQDSSGLALQFIRMHQSKRAERRTIAAATWAAHRHGIASVVPKYPAGSQYKEESVQVRGGALLVQHTKPRCWKWF